MKARKKPVPAAVAAGEVPVEKTDLWMPLWIGDYLADTMNLSRDLHGGYLLLLMAYWRNRGPLLDDDEDLASTVKASLEDWKERLKPKLLVRFFTLESNVTNNVTLNVWRHKRADEELAGAMANRAAAVARTAKATAARQEKRLAAAGESGNSGAPAAPMPPAPRPPDVQRNEERNVQRDVHVTSNVTCTPSPSPSPSPSETYSVAKATAAAEAPAPGANVASPVARPPAAAPTPPPPSAAAPAGRSGAPPGPSSRQAVIPGVEPPAPAGVAPPGPKLPLTPEEERKRDLWRHAKATLEGLDGMALKRSGGFLAQLHGKYPEVFLAALEALEARSEVPSGGVADFLTATCQHLNGEREHLRNKQADHEAGADETLRQWLKNKEVSDG